jgi:hypothetical protein
MTVVAKNFNQLSTQTPALDPPGNWVAGYGFADNPIASYDVTGTWGAGYGVAGHVLPTIGSLFILTILINTSLYYMFS